MLALSHLSMYHVLCYFTLTDLAMALKYPTPRNFFFHVAIPLANAMTFIHSRKIIHRDLKPANVLCDGNIASGKFTVKVTDFGVATEYDHDLSSVISDEDHNVEAACSEEESKKKLTGETGTYRWMAPEVIRSEPYSGKADVYSFALMVWQLLTREDPFHDESDSAAVAIRVGTEKNRRPPFPENTPKPIKDLIEKCWDDDPSKRCEFGQFTEMLQNIQSSGISSEEKTWLEDPDGHQVYYKMDEDEVPALPQQPPHRFDAGGKNKGKKGHQQSKGGFWNLFGGGSKHQQHNKGKHR